MQLTEALIREYIAQAQDICEETIKDFRSPTIEEVSITRAQSYWAQVRGVGIRRYSIRVSNVFNLIPDEKTAHNRLLSSMVHELIHTQFGCMNHLEPFQRKARCVNRKYPELNVSTGITSEAVGVTIPEKPDKYSVICVKCGATSKYKRKPDIWKYIDLKHSPYTCTSCGHDAFKGELING